MHGGDLIAQSLKDHGIQRIFTLCGGHISPILAACEQRDIGIIDVRNEATAVFAADATSRISGIPGIAAVTAGPGITNTITALKNAQMAQSPIILLGGATATLLKGRGALQDIDQMALVRPHVKWACSLRQVRELVPSLERAFRISQSGIPGPVFLECPVDLLYDEDTVRHWHDKELNQASTSLSGKIMSTYVRRHLRRVFAKPLSQSAGQKLQPVHPQPPATTLRRCVRLIKRARQPIMILGSQSMLQPQRCQALVDAIEKLGIPTYLAGMARGLLGANHPLQFRHYRRTALKHADLVILAGAPADFRLGYGRHIKSSTRIIALNRSSQEMRKNRKPTVGLVGDVGQSLATLAEHMPQPPTQYDDWFATLQNQELQRETEISEQASSTTQDINPIALCRCIDASLAENSNLVVDGGDFVATASYTVRPRTALRWLDPGVFGTLGVGAGFALGAGLHRPHAETWLFYGDGSAGYSIIEFDTFVRHQVPVIAVVGNDASWAQIAREQVDILGTPIGTELTYNDYHLVAEALGGKGILLTQSEQITDALSQAKSWAKQGHAVLINAKISATDFRKGSISI